MKTGTNGGDVGEFIKSTGSRRVKEDSRQRTRRDLVKLLSGLEQKKIVNKPKYTTLLSM